MKNSTNDRQHIAQIVGITFWFMVSATVALAQGKTIQRPIEDFVNAQGTYCMSCTTSGTTCVKVGNKECGLFVPPVANFFGWDTLQEVPPQHRNVQQPLRCASVDYASLANAKVEELLGISLGTTTSGTVTEHLRDDGRAEVSVRLYTKNALIWVASGGDGIRGTCNFTTDPLLFGYRVNDVLRGEDPALGESFLQVKFINTASGAPLPDLLQLIYAPEPGQEPPSFISLTARAEGTLRGNFGVPDGTPGRAEVIETGLFITQSRGATADNFPVERINLNVTGQ